MTHEGNREAATDKKRIQVTVFTGFLGAGKTTIILSLLKKLPESYNVALLKNEFGDLEVDSELVKQENSNVQVKEMINGCLCCVLIGQMKNALLEIKEKYHPDRVIVETSGSAFPAPVAWQIRELRGDGFDLDAIINVVDCANFTGYQDQSYTARIQAQYTDLIILNKHQLVSAREMEDVVDRINDLNTDTPRVRWHATRFQSHKSNSSNVAATHDHGSAASDDGGIPLHLIFGLDTKLFLTSHDALAVSHPPPLAPGSNKNGDTSYPHSHESDGSGHYYREVDLIRIDKDVSTELASLEHAELDAMLSKLPREDVYRVKGLVRLNPSASSDEDTPQQQSILCILNFAFGRYTLTELTKADLSTRRNVLARVTVMGQSLARYLPVFVKGLRLSSDSSNREITTCFVK